MALTTTDRATVLVVEDAPDFRQALQDALSGEGYAVTVASDGVTAVERARQIAPDVIVLDLGLPDIDGIEVCRQIREFTDAHVIMLTARCDDVDRMLGLTVGAADYMTKPFSPSELALRVEDVLDRPRHATGSPAAPDPGRLRVGEIELDTLARDVRVDGETIDLTAIEFDLLGALLTRPTMVFSRQMLLERVWGDDTCTGHHVVDVHVAHLRKKIDANGTGHIRTVRGVGYRIA